MKLIYLGDLSPMNIKIYSSFERNWVKGEVRDLDEVIASKLLKDSKNFTLVDGQEEIKEVKSEEKREEDISIEDIDKMDKDSLLDYSVELGIDTNYSQTKKELRKILKEHIGGKEE